MVVNYGALLITHSCPEFSTDPLKYLRQRCIFNTVLSNPHVTNEYDAENGSTSKKLIGVILHACYRWIQNNANVLLDPV